jgi:hypothetical protein
MLNKSKVVLSAAILLATAFAASAKDGSLPRIDLEKVCRASEKEINAVFTDINRDVFAACMSDEKTAQEQLVKDWATFSASDKARCVAPRDYLPSYVEWSTCIEMTRDVRRMRKEQVTPPAASNTRRKSPNGRTSSEAKECPVVQFRDDGTIVSVDAC